jgi:ribosomal protein L11 methyltransferase
LNGEASGVRLRLALQAAALSIFEAGLARLGGAVATDPPDEGGTVRLDVYLPAAPDPVEVTALLAAAAAAAEVPVPDYTVEPLPEVDWVAESQKALPPVRAGRFYVFGSHVAEPPPKGTVPIRIDANVAFGTGHHESTEGCLLALDALARTSNPARPLDLGCGSGILSIAMAKLWPAPVLACDLDGDAVRVTRINAAVNGVGARVRATRGDGLRGSPVARSGPYDLIVANILAEPLQRMAGDLVGALSPGGTVVLGGFLESQEGAVQARYRARGLRRTGRIVLGDWVTLVLSK